MRLARVVHDDRDVPAVEGSRQHVFFELGDRLGSAFVVFDKATSELVERSAYQAYGGAESDYRPKRWKGFREDYRFTGKEEDTEVGLTYFGKRYLNALLQRWISADPLTVHGLGADPNVYAYVSGRALSAVDPLGLNEDGVDSNSGAGFDEYRASREAEAGVNLDEATLRTEWAQESENARAQSDPAYSSPDPMASDEHASFESAAVTPEPESSVTSYPSSLAESMPADWMQTADTATAPLPAHGSEISITGLAMIGVTGAIGAVGEGSCIKGNRGRGVVVRFVGWRGAG